MLSTSKPARIPMVIRRCRQAPWIAFVLLMTACAAGPSNVPTEAPPVRLAIPQFVREPCKVTTVLNPTVSGLEVRDRARGIDVRECDGKRALAVQALDLEHALEDQQRAARDERNRPWWQRLTPWREE